MPRQYFYAPPTFNAINDRLLQVTGVKWSMGGEGKECTHRSPAFDSIDEAFAMVQRLADLDTPIAAVADSMDRRVTIGEKEAEKIMQMDVSQVRRLEHALKAATGRREL